jgi:hypothetical protein
LVSRIGNSGARTAGGAAALLALVLGSQAAWATITISPSPSTNGGYSITWAPSGCTTYNVYGFPMLYCYELHETVNGQYGSLTNYWTSGGSVNISDKSAGTYTYTIYAYYSGDLGNGSFVQDGPVDESVCTTHTVPRYTGWAYGSYDVAPYDQCSFYYDGTIQYPAQYDPYVGGTCWANTPVPQNGTIQVCN